MQKKKKKIKKASSFIFWLLRGPFKVFLRLKYKYKFDKKTSRGIKRPCIILANHQTFFDQFALPQGFNFGINFVANETIFRHGLGSRLMVALTRPIPIAKGTADSTAVKHIMGVIKDGGAVGLFPSGNRSFYGEECVIEPSIGKLVKKLNVPVVLVNLRGGFNTKPRWSNKSAKGKMRGMVTRVVNPQELAEKSVDEINEIIISELKFNEFEWNKTQQIKFKGKHKAEYLENVLFWCPECNRLDSLRSAGNDFFCSNCGINVKINDTGFFETIEGENLPPTILDWSNRQLEYIKSIDFAEFTDKPIFADDNICFLSANSSLSEQELGRGRIEQYADRLVVCGKELKIENIKDLAVGISKLSIYTTEGTFAVTAPNNVSLIKYMIICYRLKNLKNNIMEDYYGY